MRRNLVKSARLDERRAVEEAEGKSGKKLGGSRRAPTKKVAVKKTAKRG
jgi:hypothetical protein